MELLTEKVLLCLQNARYVKPKPGVYVLYDNKLDVLYIGESDNLKKEFLKYIATNFENDECKQKTHVYQRSFVGNPKERKVHLLEDYIKKYGKMPCCNADID